MNKTNENRGLGKKSIFPQVFNCQHVIPGKQQFNYVVTVI